MDFFNAGVSVGRYFGITVRLHFTFFVFAYYRITAWSNFWMGVAYVLGLYICILLHEFGHALAARWCDGEAENILLWPLGGLAFVRPAFNPTAHLITTLAGPFVSLALWLGFAGLTWVMNHVVTATGPALDYVAWFVDSMRRLNLWLLIFNMGIPAFPMDGGRTLRDTLWHWMSAEKATKIAVTISMLIGGAAIAYGIAGEANLGRLPLLPISSMSVIVLGVFVLMQARSEQHIVGTEAMGTYDFSIRERLRRGNRKREFQKGVAYRRTVEQTAAFHTCAVCQRTDHDAPDLDFRVCSDCTRGQEYCPEHLDHHQHL